ncbi:MAG: alpha/beta fold hydrolase [bacterium]
METSGVKVVDGIKMYYEIYGQGEPLLLIYGLMGNSKGWGMQIPVFSREHLVIVFDNLGGEEGLSIERLAGSTAGLLDQLGVERAHVLGASMGGTVAQRLAIDYPDKVRSLILACTLARPDKYFLRMLEVWRSLEKLDTLERARELSLWMFGRSFFESYEEEIAQAESIASQSPEGLDVFINQCAAIKGYDASDQLGRISAPTLVIVGEEDILTPPRLSRYIASRIPDAKLAILKGGAHALFTEVPDLAHRAILDFLREHRSTPP